MTRGYPGRGLHGETVQELGRRVMRGQYAPGETIHPEELEAEMGVSKTVVREALRVLGAKGLVDSRPKRGTFVRERSAWSLLDGDVMDWQRQAGMTPAFLDELAEVRLIVEPAWAQLASLRRTEGDLAALQEAVDAMSSADGDAEQAVAADLRFHGALLAAAHNELLASMDVILSNGLDARDRLVHKPGDIWRDPTPAHQGVVDMIRAGDPAGSARAVLDLLQQAVDDVELAQRPTGSRKPRRAARKAGTSIAATQVTARSQ